MYLRAFNNQDILVNFSKPAAVGRRFAVATLSCDYSVGDSSATRFRSH